MPEYLGPDDMAAELADLRRRLHALETAPQSNIVSLLDGQFRFRTSLNENVQAFMSVDSEGDDIGFWSYVDDGGTAAERAYLGTATDGLDARLVIYNRDGRRVLDAISAAGLQRPVVPVPWVKNPAAPVDATTGSARTSSASYDTLYRSYLNCSTHVYHRWAIDLQAGVTAVAFKLTGQDTFNGGVETTIYEQTGITADGNIEQNTALPVLAADGLSIVGEVIEVRAYLRITGGAGNATLAPIWPTIPTQG